MAGSHVWLSIIARSVANIARTSSGAQHHLANVVDIKMIPPLSPPSLAGGGGGGVQASFWLGFVQLRPPLYNIIHHNAVQCSAVQCSAVQCSAVQCSAVQCSAVQCSAVQCSAVQCSAVQCSAVQCSAVQCSAVQCSAVYIYISLSRNTIQMS